MTPYIKTLFELDLLQNKGVALDLGCGKGDGSSSLRELGFDVTAVDLNPPEKLDNIRIIKSDIRDFIFEPDKYSVIICWNVLPFIQDKTTVEELLMKMVNALKKDGILNFSLFGTKDAWINKPDMSFFENNDVEKLLSELEIKIVQRNEVVGLMKTMKGDLKQSQVFRYILQKI